MSTHFWVRCVARSAALVAFVWLSGCYVHRVDDDRAPPVEVPEGFSQAGAGAERIDKWWQSLGDPELNRLIARVVTDNLDLKRGWARLAQARALARQAGAGYYPSVQAEVGTGYSRRVTKLPAPLGTTTTDSASYNLSVGAAYEVDLWRRVASAASAAEADVAASRQDVEALAMTLVAQVAESWVVLKEQRALLELLAKQIELNRTNLELMELRFKVGQAGAADIYQQRLQVAGLESQQPLVEARAAVLTHQLAVLTGRAPGAVAGPASGELAALGPLPAVGLPVALLDRRPDVRAARLRILAQDHRVGVAIADRYPKLSLTASTGFQSTDIADLFTSWIFNLAANLVAPLFDGGRRAAEVDRNRAALEDLVHAYGQVTLTAFREVEDALVQEAKQREYLERLETQRELAQATLDETRARYVQGTTDYLPVIVALRSLQQLEQGELAARRQLVSYRIQLHRALGGAWTQQLAPAAAAVAEQPDESGTEAKEGQKGTP